MQTPKPFSPACERNRGPILDVLRQWLPEPGRVLEVGSGTGQHAVHFAAALPTLTWQTSERAEQLDGLRAWLDEAALPNTPPPLALDVGGPWPNTPFDAIFSANTLHIMSWDHVCAFFAALPAVMVSGAPLIIYGPFNADGRFTSDSNQAFDAWLKARDTHMGIRDAAEVDALAARHGLALVHEAPMPAHNLCRIWRYAG
ncbi:DUF938 domain-containing protein [Oleiagrimonas sp. C23AA]|uniref:DUF938 domain-containing protein n=1 Tax=Oleiagrimonas sp. C23AA TaxID=2719047 RepID=UPI001422C272|nr:DUF938 domain-containing protein [Oleiagrimonas sp. C23AA]NII12182.1 DUF938 domain-containing protein [Oleiagrimonas sp. C23AA]